MSANFAWFPKGSAKLIVVVPKPPMYGQGSSRYADASDAASGICPMPKLPDPAEMRWAFSLREAVAAGFVKSTGHAPNRSIFITKPNGSVETWSLDGFVTTDGEYLAPCDYERAP